MNGFRKVAFARRKAIAALVLGAALTGASGSAFALAPGCEKIKSLMGEQQRLVSLVKQKTAHGKKMTPGEACGLFGQIVSNGSATLKWVESNKAWCQIPDQFIDSIKQGNVKVSKIRANACKVAAQERAMTKRAAQGGMNALGGGDDGLSGRVKIPQGAL